MITKLIKHGKTKNGNQHYKCKNFQKTSVENYNNCRCYEALNNLTPSDVYFGRADKILEQRAIIKQQTIAKRRQLYFQEKIINL
ncbi:hypothetical protein IF125_08325 [Empedobacter stercoris]|nr:hypothetical protein [Empedobacter stercoris]